LGVPLWVGLFAASSFRGFPLLSLTLGFIVQFLMLG
jgi:hypothetical protein